jgi:hypothetical protein
MHDPMTTAFDIRYPWPWPKQELSKQRDIFITIWHVDPETDGSDDSCGWSFPKPSHPIVDAIQHDLEFFTEHQGKTTAPLTYQRSVEGSLAWWILWMNRTSYWHRKRGLSPKQVADYTFANSFPGNRDEGLDPDADLKRTAWIIARAYMHYTRPWWRHPRWHIWHWKIQIHPLLLFKRWLWSRCYVCGESFAWGEAPVTNSWNGKGPRWFQGEPDVRHGTCNDPSQVSELASIPRQPVQ